MGKKKMKENEVVQFLKDEVEIVTGLKCKVVPQSDTWYDGFCLDTGNLSLHMFLEGNLEERLLRIKEQIEDHKNRKVTTDDEIKNIIKSKKKGECIRVIRTLDHKDFSTIFLINNGVGRNLSRLRIELPFESDEEV